MQERLSLGHWIPAYPLPLFEEQVEKGNVWGVFDAIGRAVATFTVSREAPSYFDLSLWSGEGEPALYATRLGVLPGLQNRGIGTCCVATVEELAADLGCRSVRFDAVANHQPLLAYHRKLGYREVGCYEAFGSQMVGFEKLVVPGEAGTPRAIRR